MDKVKEFCNPDSKTPSSVTFNRNKYDCLHNYKHLVYQSETTFNLETLLSHTFSNIKILKMSIGISNLFLKNNTRQFPSIKIDAMMH